MARAMNYQIKVNADLHGNLTSQLQSAQAAMNAFKNAGNFSKNFGDNLKVAAKYASNIQDVAKIAALMNPPSANLTAKLGNLQNLQNQIQQYKDALRAVPKLQQQYQQQLRQNSQAAADKRAAAEKVANLKVQLESFKAAQAGLKRTSTEYKSLQAQIKATKAEIKSANDALKIADTAFKTSQNRTFEAGQNLSRQISQLRELRGALSAAGVSASQLGAAESNLRGQIDATTAALRRQQEMAGRRANFQNAANNFSDAYSNFQNALQTAETIMNPFTSATQMAMDYEYEMSAIKAKTMFEDIRAGNIDVVNKQMAQLDATAKHLGATTEYTTTEIARSMDKFAMSGYKWQDIDRIIPSFINIGTVTKTFGGDLVRLADTFTDDFAAMGYKVGQQIQLNNGGGTVSAENYFGDIYGYALNKSNMDSESFHNAVKYFAPVTSALGLRGSEALAVAMFNASAGQKGSQFGNALKTGLMRMVAPTKMTREALDAMGMADMDLSDATREAAETQAFLQSAIPKIDTHNFLQMLQDIKAYLDTLDDGDKVGWLGSVVGKNAAPVWTKIFSDPHGIEEIVKNAQFMESAGINNYTADVSNTYRESAKVQWEMLKSSWDANIQQIGSSLLPVAIELSQTLAPLLISTAEWLGENKELVVTLAGVAAALSAVIVGAAGIQLIGAAWGMVTASATLASGAISRVFAALSGVTFASLGAAIRGIGTAFLAAARGAMAFIATPIGAAIAVIAAAAYLIYDNWEPISAFLSDTANKIGLGFEVLKNKIKAFKEELSEMWDGLKEKFGDFNITERLSKSWQDMKSYFGFGEETQTQIKAAGTSTTEKNSAAMLANAGISGSENLAQIRLDTSNVQAQINQLGDSASQNAVAISNNSAVQDGVNLASQNVSASMTAASTAAVANSTAVQTATTAAQNSAPAIDGLTVSAANSTAGIDSLAQSSGTASGNVAGLGDAALSAISGLLSAAAQAGSDLFARAKSFIFGGDVAQNAKGGIYRRNAFLTWFAEKSPEAAIPLDGSERAIELWQQAGAILGVYPGTATLENAPTVTPSNLEVGGGSLMNIVSGDKLEVPQLNLPQLPKLELPQLPNFNLENILPNFSLENILPNFSLENLLPNISAIFGNILPNISTVFGNLPNLGELWDSNFPSESGGILNGGLTGGVFPGAMQPAGDVAQNYSGDTYNFTFNITGNANAAETRRSFEAEFSDWAEEQKRKSLRW